PHPRRARRDRQDPRRCSGAPTLAGFLSVNGRVDGRVDGAAPRRRSCELPQPASLRHDLAYPAVYGRAMSNRGMRGRKAPRPGRHRGAVTLRGEAIPATTADQRLLDSRAREDWKQKDAWRALRILSEFVEGFDTLADLPKGGGGV